MKHLSNTSPFRYSDVWLVRFLFVPALILTGAVFLTPKALAASVDVSPILIDWEGQRRDEFRETISITNNNGHVVTVWPIIADIDAETGEIRIPDGPGDGHDRLSTWVELRRTNIYLKPGATKTVGLKVQSSVHADVGTYHGIIAFPVAESFEDAETKLAGAGTATVTVRVLENRVEQLNILRFGSLRRLLMAFPAVFELEVDNGGNVPTPLAGKVKFFDRNDNPVGEITLTGEELIDADAVLTTAIDWSGSGTFGRHKALIELSYGDGNIVTDSTQFYVIPWWALAMFVGLSLLAVALVTRLITRAHRHHA